MTHNAELTGRGPEAKTNDQSERAPVESDVIRRIANIAHNGGLIGFDDIYKAMNEIRRLSLPWCDKEDCDRLQRNGAYSVDNRDRPEGV